MIWEMLFYFIFFKCRTENNTADVANPSADEQTYIYACCLIAHIQDEAMRADVSESQSESESESVYVWIACQSANLSHVCIL